MMITPKLTFLGIKRDMNIIMFARIIRHIQTDKVRRTTSATTDATSATGATPATLLLGRIPGPGQRELGVDQADDALARSLKGFVHVGALELEIHAAAVAEILEEGQQLERLGLLHDLDPTRAGFPFLVDGHHHAAAGDGEGGHHAKKKLHKENISF